MEVVFIWPIEFLLQAELGKPSLSHPDQGKVFIYVECSPTAEPSFEVCTWIHFTSEFFFYLFHSFVRKFCANTNLSLHFLYLAITFLIPNIKSYYISLLMTYLC